MTAHFVTARVDREITEVMTICKSYRGHPSAKFESCDWPSSIP